jgi:tRNA-Thr(GGU) m(6)t(6)A37 methyltransferase TsaA
MKNVKREGAMIQLKPIGIVRNAITEAHRDTRWDEIESEIIVDDEWRDALDGLEQFSHIWVICYFDRMSAPDSLRVRPMQRDAERMPLVGLFATRTPQRPNPIGICVVPLLEVRGSLLRVRGLDALDGTPVLDLKPYLARGDAIENTRVGEWVRKYWEMLQ